MNIVNREIRLFCNSVAPIPYFERIVIINQHDISLRVYATGVEECIVNGYVYAIDTLEMIREDLGSARASEAFHDLTAFWVADWDRAYRRLWWRDFMDARGMWYGVWYGQWPRKE